MMVSIIIPVYNVEKYLPRCIESVLSQTYSFIEVILVDDGSTDNSGKICDRIALINPEVKVIHKENGGLSSARNTGIEIAKGEAIFFLDSDDYLSHDCIEKCVQIMDKTNSDISIIQMMYISEETNNEIKGITGYEEEILSASEAIEASLYQIKFSCCAPAKLYRRKVIGNIRFPVGRLSEDLATCHLFLNNANKIVYINNTGYYYRQHTESIMHTFNIKRMDALVWAKEILNFCKVNYPYIEKAALCRIFNISIHLILEIPDDGYEEQKNILWNEIRKTRVQVLIDKKSRKREKIASILSFFGYKVLKRVWKSRFAVKQKEFK